ncbi:diguanylate cyclase [Lysobacter koreensis]|uniref:diguanylate cyclase n=1 Tax=Lysobacter koreensis TaxID=266122 RepID=A0ABW2YNS9_9GAMM
MPALAALLALAGACAPAAAQERPDGRGPRPTTAAAFDRAFERIAADAAWEFDEKRARADLATLHELLPPGDARRELGYRALACAWHPDEPASGRAFAERGIADARRARAPQLQVHFHYCRASHAEVALDTRAAITDYGTGIMLARSLGEARLHGDGLALRGGVRSRLGEQALALIDTLDAGAVYRRAGLRARAEANLQRVAIVYRRMGEHRQALRYLERSRVVSLRERNWISLISDELQTAYAFEDLGQAAQALAAYERALQVARDHGFDNHFGFIHLGMAYAQTQLGAPARALQLLDQAQAEFAAAGDHTNAGMLELRRGEANAALGRHARALRHFDRAAPLLQREDNERYLAMFHLARAATLEALGRPQPALADFRRYLQLHDALQRRLGDERTRLLQHRFDAKQREHENRRLVAETRLRDARLEALLRARRWQWSALGLGAVLILLMVALVLRQVRGARRLRDLAHTDALTGVANRRRIEQFGEDAIAHARDDRRPLTTLVIDIDHFKRINDTHGHDVGDAVLTRVAQTCSGALRQGDLLGRSGGEEFLVVLPDADQAGGLRIAERLRASVERLALDDLAPGLRVSVSVGVARLRREDRGLVELTRRADSALYRAKHDGRNRIEDEALAASA